MHFSAIPSRASAALTSEVGLYESRGQRDTDLRSDVAVLEEVYCGVIVICLCLFLSIFI